MLEGTQGHCGGPEDIHGFYGPQDFQRLTTPAEVIRRSRGFISCLNARRGLEISEFSQEGGPHEVAPLRSVAQRFAQRIIIGFV